MRSSMRWIVAGGVAAGLWLAAAAAFAGDRFEKGFQDELGRIAAHEAVYVGKHLLGGLVYGHGGHGHVVHRRPYRSHGYAPSYGYRGHGYGHYKKHHKHKHRHRHGHGYCDHRHASYEHYERYEHSGPYVHERYERHERHPYGRVRYYDDDSDSDY